MVFYYSLMQSVFWVLFHVTALFWGIAFPFHYRKIKANGYIKYIHITAVAVAVLVPLVSALIPLKDSFIPPRIPPIVCTAATTEHTFYALVLPASILLAISTCLLIITFWIILKVTKQCGLELIHASDFFVFQEFVIKKISKGRKISRVGKAQVKIMFVFCYYIVLGGLVLGVFSYYVGISDRLIADQQKFFACESLGTNTGKDCQALKSSAIEAFSDLALVGFIMQGLVSFVVLIFTIDCKGKKSGRKTRPSTKYSAATNPIAVQQNNPSVE